ncbi:unnamed protein product, partial [Allacma fusca]
TIQVHESA